jgi:hypothetical protein
MAFLFGAGSLSAGSRWISGLPDSKRDAERWKRVALWPRILS